MAVEADIVTFSTSIQSFHLDLDLQHEVVHQSIILEGTESGLGAGLISLVQAFCIDSSPGTHLLGVVLHLFPRMRL